MREITVHLHLKNTLVSFQATAQLAALRQLLVGLVSIVKTQLCKYRARRVNIAVMVPLLQVAVLMAHSAKHQQRKSFVKPEQCV